MQGLAARCSHVVWIDDTRIQCECPLCAATHGGTDPDRNLFATQDGDSIDMVCFAGHTDEDILAALNLTRADLLDPPPHTTTADTSESPSNGFSTNGTTHHAAENGSAPEEPAAVDYATWRYDVGMVVKKALDDVPEKERPTIASMDPVKLIDLLVKQSHEVVDERVAPWWPLPPELSESEVDEELHTLAGKAVEVFRDVYLPAVSNGHVPAVVDLPIETFDAAIIANQRYLERVPVIEGLCFSSACSMITGGKHSGKSTLARWEAICVVKGYRFLDRVVQQGPVIYLASEDEEMVARAELMKLGWIATDPLFFVGKSQIPDDLDEQAVLNLLAEQIRKRSAVLCVVDMLFDFIPVRDELGYAETRRAVGLIQDVASRTGIHLTVLHHAPKHTSLSADAAIAALGSQGLAARVSPIVLTRRYGPGVHAVVSTSVRDPRGKAIHDSRLLMMADGSLKLGGGFKAFMLAEVYADRMLELLEEEPGQEFTVSDAIEKLGIEYAPARATLKHLFDHGKCQRAGAGKKRSPYRYFVPLTEIRATDDQPPDPDSVRPRGTSTISTTPEVEAEGRFGYKENEWEPPPVTHDLDEQDDVDEFGISRSK